MKPLELSVSGGVLTLRLWPTVIAAVMLAMLLSLGVWQIERLAWKENLLATIALRMKEAPVRVSAVTQSEADFRPAFAVGTFTNGKEIFLHAISKKDEGGWRVLAPMRLTNGAWLLVDRGFIPFGKAKAGDFYRPEGSVTVRGILRLPHHMWPQPSNNPLKGDWYWPDLAALARVMQVPQFMPFVLEADASPNPGGYPEGGQTRLDIPNNHFGYALTWFGLALALAIIYLTSAYSKKN